MRSNLAFHCRPPSRGFGPVLVRYFQGGNDMLGAARPTPLRDQAARSAARRDARPRLRLRADEPGAALLSKIQDRSAVVGMVGLGYVGLPFAVEKAKAGFHVIGIEQNAERAKQVNAGENYIPDVKDEELSDLVRTGRLEAVTDFTRAAEMDVVVIAVQTPLTKNLTPDLRFVENVTHELARHARPGQLISLESTTYPG